MIRRNARAENDGLNDLIEATFNPAVHRSYQVGRLGRRKLISEWNASTADDHHVEYRGFMRKRQPRHLLGRSGLAHTVLYAELTTRVSPAETPDPAAPYEQHTYRLALAAGRLVWSEAMALQATASSDGMPIWQVAEDGLTPEMRLDHAKVILGQLDHKRIAADT